MFAKCRGHVAHHHEGQCEEESGNGASQISLLAIVARFHHVVRMIPTCVATEERPYLNVVQGGAEPLDPEHGGDMAPRHLPRALTDSRQ